MARMVVVTIKMRRPNMDADVKYGAIVGAALRLGAVVHSIDVREQEDPEDEQTCTNCGHVVRWEQGCWVDDDGYACPAIPQGPDQHVPMVTS